MHGTARSHLGTAPDLWHGAFVLSREKISAERCQITKCRAHPLAAFGFT